MTKPGQALLLSVVFSLAACGPDDEPSESGSGGSAGGGTAGSMTTGGAGSSDAGTSSDGGMPGDGGSSSAQAGSVSGGSGGSSSTAGSGSYLRCESAADCEPYGGSKVCCVAGPMHFCTKPSACTGETLP